MKNPLVWTYKQDGGIGKHASPPSRTTEKKLHLDYKTTPESSGNRAVWKSDNQGFKEATFILMDRRGRDVERGGEVQSHGSGKEKSWKGWSYIHMWWIKFGKDTSRVRDPSPRPDHPAAQGSSTRKMNPHNFWL